MLHFKPKPANAKKRPMHGNMDRRHVYFLLRWLTPLMIAALGVSFTLWNHLTSEPGRLSVHAIREVLFFGTVGPLLAWLTLSWAVSLAEANARATEELERRNQALLLLNTVGETAGQSLELQEILDGALDRILGFMGLEVGSVWVLEGSALRLKSQRRMSANFVEHEATVPLGECLCGLAVRCGQLVQWQGVDSDSGMTRPACLAEGFCSVTCVPLQAQGRSVGVINLASRNRRTFSPPEEQLLATVGHEVANAIENARLYAETRHRARQLQAASAVSQNVTSILEVDEVVTQVVTLIREMFDYYHAHLFLVDEHSNEIVLRECSGPADEALKARGLRFKIGEEGITGWVASSGQPVLCNDVSQEPRYYPHELLLETRSELAVPLRVGSRVVGVLDVQSEQREAFQKDDLTVLQILADQVAIAIQNASLFQETQRQVELLRVLHDIALSLTSQLESEKLPAAILAYATRLLRTQGSSLSLYDRQTDLIRIVAVHNAQPEYAGMALRLGDGVAGRVVATGEPLIVNDYRTWAGRSSQVSHLDQTYEAVLSVPLRWQGETFGALITFDHADRRRFVQEDIQPLSLFADLASIALKNAELYSQVRQFNERLEQQVEERTRELAQAREALAEKAKQLQRLLATTIGIQEEERARIAQDLHDESNQLITGALYEIQAAQEGVRGQRGEIALAKLETAKSLLRKIDDVNRWIISGLRPLILDAQGLVPALKWHADAYEKSYRIPCVVQVSGRPERMMPEVELAIYRIVQESLNNVAAHAQAQSVHIQVEFRPTRLRVVVEDDGVGFDYESVLTAAPGQMGLIGMRERAQSIGGRIEVQSAPGQGTRLVVEVPLPIESAPDVTSV